MKRIMSSVLPMSVLFGRTIINDTASRCSYMLVNRHPALSTYRKIWSNLMNKNSVSASDTKASESSAESKVDPQVKNEASADVIANLHEEIEELKKVNEDLNDKYKRMLATSINEKSRWLKQVEEAKIYGIQAFCKDLVEVADVLSKANECVPKEEINDKNPHLKNLYNGLTMMELELKKVFTKHGLLIINPVGEKFDPNLHEAVFHQEFKGKESGTVGAVLKTGYKLNDRVIRPAKVGVAK